MKTRRHGRGSAPLTSVPATTVASHRGKRESSSAGRTGVRARGSVLHDAPVPWACCTMTDSASHTASVASAPGASCPAKGVPPR